MTEKERVEEHSKIANYAGGVMRFATLYCGKIFERHMKKGSVLEMGPAEGVMTDLLFPKFSADYTVVDGADFFVNDLKKRYPSIKGFVSLFEDFIPENNKKYDNIVLGHVLEHVENPVSILKKCGTLLNNIGGNSLCCS